MIAEIVLTSSRRRLMKAKQTQKTMVQALSSVPDAYSNSSAWPCLTSSERWPA